MEAIEYRIFQKRQQLRDLLNFTLRQNPTQLLLVKEIKNQILVCDYAIDNLLNKKTKYKLG
jgi:hypothetical protein